jgi:protein-tyrosine phosphatase
MTFVAVVCTGNVCRSPAAELLLHARLGHADVTVRSSGIRALVGNPVDPPMAELLRARGLDPEPFRARALQPEELRRADLVIALTREHRAGIVAADPSAVRRTFLMGELAVLAPAVAAAGWPDDLPHGAAAARLAALPRLAAAHRSLVRSDDDLDVADPFGRSAVVYAQTMDQIATAVDTLVEAIDR